MIKCPYCGYDQGKGSRVIYTRSSKKDQTIRRRRECLHCLDSFTTKEVLEVEFRKMFKLFKALSGFVVMAEQALKGLKKLQKILNK